MLVTFVLLSVSLGAGMASWLSCPPSINPDPLRSVEFEGPCEQSVLEKASPRMTLRAGDRLKVGWPSRNQGGGYVRLALVPIASRLDGQAFDKSVLKVTCFGHDEREDKYIDGYCHHPCNARGGCDYQGKRSGGSLEAGELSDENRYDTTIGIPTNLPDGDYVLQWKAVVASNRLPAYSCTLLRINGGQPTQKCSNLLKMRLPSVCEETKDGLTLSEFLGESFSLGPFCYNKEGSPDVDATLGMRPVNWGCDPRQSCSLALSRPTCLRDMTEPSNPRNPKVICPKAKDQQPMKKNPEKARCGGNSHDGDGNGQKRGTLEVDNEEPKADLVEGSPHNKKTVSETNTV